MARQKLDYDHDILICRSANYRIIREMYKQIKKSGNLAPDFFYKDTEKPLPLWEILGISETKLDRLIGCKQTKVTYEDRVQLLKSNVDEGIFTGRKYFNLQFAPWTGIEVVFLQGDWEEYVKKDGATVTAISRSFAPFADPKYREAFYNPQDNLIKMYDYFTKGYVVSKKEQEILNILNSLNRLNLKKSDIKQMNLSVVKQLTFSLTSVLKILVKYLRFTQKRGILFYRKAK